MTALSERVDLRRIITGRDSAGRSRVLFDDAGHDHGGNVEIWSTCEEGIADPAGGPLRLLPPHAGSKVRYVLIPPEVAEADQSDEARRQAARAFFGSMGAAHVLVDDIPHPHAHRTATIDYIIMISGELTLLLEDGEHAIRPGNVVVQRGTSHAWVNRGSGPALFVAVMIDCSRSDGHLGNEA